MSALLGSMLGLSFGITFSPEILIVGLWLATQREEPVKKAWMFFAGGFTGIFILLFLGLMFSKSGTAEPSWTHFSFRAVFGTLLILMALHSIFKGRHLHRKVTKIFEKGVCARTAFFLGLGSAIVNVKVISLATAAGHTLASSKVPDGERLAGLAVFIVMASIPFLVAAALASVKQGIVSAIMSPCERLFQRYGRWIVVVICAVLGIELWRQALIAMP